jgi:hypothetical protein
LDGADVPLNKVRDNGRTTSTFIACRAASWRFQPCVGVVATFLSRVWTAICTTGAAIADLINSRAQRHIADYHWRVYFPFAALPVPDSGTDWGELVRLS